MDHNFAAFIAICASMLMLTSVGLADSPPSIPETFTGNVTVNGEPAPDGTIVSAWIDGVKKANQSITGGTYNLEVSGSDGDTITFKIYDTVAATDTYNEPGNPDEPIKRDLSAEGVVIPTPYLDDSSDPTGATVEELGRTSAEEQGDEESSRSIPGFAGLTGVFMLLIFGLGRNMK